MKFQKKTLGYLAAAGMLSLNFVAGCDDTAGGSSTGGSQESEKPKAYKWAKVDPALLGGTQHATGLAVSGNSDWLYVATAKEGKNDLYAVNVSNLEANLNNKTAWTQIEYGADKKADGFDNKVPGKANIEGANQIVSMSPASDGVVVGAGSSDLTFKNDKNGAFYVKADKIVNAWNHTGVPGKHVSSSDITADLLSAGKPIRAYVVSKADKEYVYMSTWGGSYDVFFGELGTDKKIDMAIKPNLTNPIIAQEADSTPLYIVDEEGLRTVSAENIGKSVTLKAGVLGPKNWKIQGHDGDNKFAKAVAVVGDNIFIGLNGEEGVAVEGQGGVLIYKLKERRLLPLSANWNKRGILSFAKDGNAIYAVTSTGLLDVSKADGTFTTLSAKDEEGGELLPKSNITSARFVKGNLLITTKDKGIVYRLKAEPSK